MPILRLVVDDSGIKNLDKEIRQATLTGLRRVVERGEQILHQEVPKDTHNLEHGISSLAEGTTLFDADSLQATLIISARSGRTGARTATVHYPSGRTKTVSLRPQPAYNYAEVVAKGRPALLRPKSARVFLIPGQPKSGESYLTSEGKTFVLRPSIGATKPNPYDERTAVRLEGEAGGIVEKAFGDLFG